MCLSQDENFLFVTTRKTGQIFIFTGMSLNHCNTISTQFHRELGFQTAMGKGFLLSSVGNGDSTEVAVYEFNENMCELKKRDLIPVNGYVKAIRV